MLKLCVVLTFDMSIEKWERSGVLERELALYGAMLDLGVQITLLTYGDQNDKNSPLLKDTRIDVIPIYSMVKRPRKKIFRILQSFILPFYLLKYFQNFHIIKSNQMFGAWVVIILARLVRAKSVVRCGFEKYSNVIETNPFFLKKFFYWVLSYISYKCADHVILTTHSMMSFVHKEFKIPLDGMVIIPNYVDIDRYSPGRVCKKNGKLVFVGRISYAKNITLLLDSVKNSGYEIDMIGDGEDLSEMQKYAKKINVKANFIGRLTGNKISNIIPSYEIFISTSRYEGHPKALIEAMSCGLPCICTDVRGNNDVINDNINGILCKEDASIISSKISTLMLNNSLKKDIGRMARKDIVEYYNLKNIVSSEVRLYYFLKSQ
jgi:glycosyltransferase involved in cell wall biosynthesis